MLEIIVAMFLSICKIIGYIIDGILVLTGMGLAFLLIGSAGMCYSRWRYRKEDEAAQAEQEKAYDDGEEEFRTPGAGERLIVSRSSGAMWRELDGLMKADDAIFKNTEEL